MAMLAGGSKGINADLNVTPMIDILLVLLIIFMIMLPEKPTGLDVQIPKEDQTNDQQQIDATIVIQLKEADIDQPRLKINQEDVTWGDLSSQLQRIFLKRKDKTAYIQGDDGVAYEYVARVIDTAHGAGIERVGLMSKGG